MADRCIRLGVWWPKGGVGKTTNTVLLSLVAAARGAKVLACDLDPEAGLSRDLLGPSLSGVKSHLKSFLESPVPVPPPVVATGNDKISLVPCPRGEGRFFRLFPEHSRKLRDGLDLVAAAYQLIIVDIANEFDNVAILGLQAVDYLVCPIELTLDCLDRVDLALGMIEQARIHNPRLRVLGLLALSDQRQLTAQEELVLQEFERTLAPQRIRAFRTRMHRSPATVATAKSHFDLRLLHYTARARFQSLFAEIERRVAATSFPLPHDERHRTPEPARAAAAVAA